MSIEITKDGKVRLEGFKDSLSKRDLVEAVRQLEERVEELEEAGRKVQEFYYEGEWDKHMSAIDGLDEVLKTEGLGPKGLGEYEGKK